MTSKRGPLSSPVIAYTYRDVHRYFCAQNLKSTISEHGMIVAAVCSASNVLLQSAMLFISMQCLRWGLTVLNPLTSANLPYCYWITVISYWEASELKPPCSTLEVFHWLMLLVSHILSFSAPMYYAHVCVNFLLAELEVKRLGRLL